jgi:hypothetical protein
LATINLAFDSSLVRIYPIVKILIKGCLILALKCCHCDYLTSGKPHQRRCMTGPEAGFPKQKNQQGKTPGVTLGDADASLAAMRAASPDVSAAKNPRTIYKWSQVCADQG